MVHKMISQFINSQEADACYTKLTKLWWNDTQLPHKGLQQQLSYFSHVVTKWINTTTCDKYTNLSMEYW